MYPNTYTVRVQHAAVAAAKNLITLTAASGKALQILSAELSNRSNELNEQLTFAIYAVTAAGTGTPTYVVPQPVVVGGTAATATLAAHTYATTEPTLATVPIYEQGGPSLAGWFYYPRYKSSIKVPAGSAVTFRIVDTSFSACDLTLVVKFAEMTSGDPFLE